MEFSLHSVSVTGHSFISLFTQLESRDGLLDLDMSLDLLESWLVRSRACSIGTETRERTQRGRRELTIEFRSLYLAMALGKKRILFWFMKLYLLDCIKNTTLGVLCTSHDVNLVSMSAEPLSS